MYTVVVDDGTFGIDSRRLMRCLSESGIQTRPLWQPLHRSQAHRDSPPADCPIAERLYRQALSLPCSVGLSEHDQQRVIEAIRALARRSGAADNVRTGARL
jgi:perosamine synthetase